jgi:DNA ligase-1
MLLQRVVETSRRIAEVSSRNEKVDIRAAVLRAVRTDEIEMVVGFLTGSPRQGRMGIGPSALRQAQVDLSVEVPALELWEVDTEFDRIATRKGRGSPAERVRLLRRLNERATSQEQEFLMRLLLGDLRQGALDGLMTEAVAQAAGVTSAKVRRAVMATGDLGAVTRTALTVGADGLSQCTVQLFRPIQPMLAQPSDIVGALARLGEATLEYKLDGARIQIHKAGDEVKVFSRRLRDVTHAVPEVLDVVSSVPARELILDGEVIALKLDGAPQPFQVTMRRFGRKLDVGRLQRELPLAPFVFDILYLDGQDLTEVPQAQRSAILTELATETWLTPSTVTADTVAAEEFLVEAIRRGHEGIMAKARDASYEAGSRGQSWLKVKPAHTLDLLVLAGEWGHGRRRGWLSNLHLAARDPEAGGFVMLGKTFKGMTDEMLSWQTRRLLELEIGRDRHTVFVRPELVVEVAFNNVQESPQYPAGLALRFARIKRYRTDKVPSDADTLEAVRKIYQRATGGEPPPRR